MLVVNVRRSLGHRHGFGYLVGALAAGFLPWTLLLLFSPSSLARRHTRAARTLITHRFPLEDASRAFEVAADRASGASKVVLVP